VINTSARTPQKEGHGKLSNRTVIKARIHR